MKKSLKKAPIINNDIINPTVAKAVAPEVVKPEATKPNFIISLFIKILRWTLNKIIQLITYLSTKSPTFASLFDPILKHLGFLITIAAARQGPNTLNYLNFSITLD